ncbi:MAG TPA: PQQ-dependent sugar dehydrogenase [Geodermatophilus sp.]|nr:PQQ-dependent sugar dehydrogenase [Geodermatophilus sp.]
MRRRLTCLVIGTLLLGACTGTPEGPAAGTTTSPEPGTSASASPPTPPPVPTLEITVVADGLDHPWDVAQAPDGTLLVDERPGGLTAVLPGGEVVPVEADFGDLYARGETGLMGLVLDPGFERNRRFYTCQGVQGPDPSIAVIAWTIARNWRSATRVADPLLGGLPANERSGRHGGCRMRFGPDGALLIGTGDSLVGTNPQDLGSLGGKVLRIDAATGRPFPGNPFADRPEPAAAYIWTYGHRNVQGVAIRPGTGQVFAAEQGTQRDDEVTLLRPGANGGYNPAADGGYLESAPMTDPSLPGVVSPTWASGAPTIASCGATFLDGEQWGAYEGLLLLGVLKGRGVLALRIAPDGTLLEQFRLPEFEGRYGRIRTVQQGDDGNLYVTTDNGGNADQLLRVTPRV